MIQVTERAAPELQKLLQGVDQRVWRVLFKGFG